jgi:RNA polymerase sigma-70 factor (ECF subfamily)
MSAPQGDITVLLAGLRQGDRAAESQLASIVYGELRRIAARFMRRERSDHTLQATALVNDAYLKLMAQNKDWQNRAHFFAVASSLMRRILVDHARSHQAVKRGGGAAKVDLDQPDANSGLIFTPERSEQLLALDESLSRLNKMDERQFRIVEMRFFGGMTDQEIAEVLGISIRTVVREWVLARAWLHSELSK